ncbi:ABC transporter ATP-binding protein [Tessaracoccus caeni]|uniref:ABC transporter ATP-binding protein n=1 Tax=Tessaracoccus caeni TaxID=3031239 RepID=UPI0023DBED27|nr:ABC transporter ATP-binding protein [Tessaracoccus caeni]MDF1488558.1 ABC transporter ATP-binding protein [Tessaracoccus caeni]
MTASEAPRPRVRSADRDRLRPSALKRTLGVLRPHLRQHAGLSVLGIAAMFVDVILRILEPWPLKIAVDAVSTALGADLGTGQSADIGTVIPLAAVALAAIVAGRAIANYVSTIALAKVGARIATELRARVFHHVQALSMRYHSKASIGDTSQRLVGDVGRLQEAAVTAGLPLVGNLATVIILMGVMVWMNPVLSLIIFVAAVAYGLLSTVASPRITKASRQTRKGEGALVSSAAEALAAIRVVQSYGLENTVAKGFAQGNARAMKAGVKARRLAAGLERSTDVLVGIAQAVVLVFGSWQVLRGAMTPGDLVLFLMYLKIATRPLRDLAKYTGRIARASASGERIADLLDEQIEIADRPGASALESVRGTVAFEGLTSTDGHGRPLFRNLSLTIPAGEHVGILGASGAGKSTLMSYLLRLAEPDQGRIVIDGQSIADATLASLRSQVSVLLQESVLFSVSIRENIRFGRLDATDEEVEDAARRADAHDFIEGLPDGYDTVLGQRGDTLSGGQRQRLAIARALIRQSPIVVLDEATTGLDPATKAQVAASLEELTRGRTTLSVTHDPAMIAGLDRVVWLENGRIVEDGAPQDLLRLPGTRFARWMSSHSEEAA